MGSRPIETVLITGASTGLGLALARRLVDSDYRLILTARASSMHRFAEAGIAPSERIWLRPLDVTDAEQRVRVVMEALERWDGVDVLVNNAGVAYRSVVEHVSEADRLAQMDINFRSPMELVRLVLPRMRRKRRGRIINVSSVSGMMAMPTMAVYAASKFALEGSTEALWYEVKPWGIHVTLIQPGFINSEAFQKVRTTALSQRSLEQQSTAYGAHYRNMAPFIERVMNLAVATPEQVAKKVERVMRRRRPPLRQAATPDALFFGILRRVMPRRLYHGLLYRMLPNIGAWGSDERPSLPAPPSDG